MKEIDLDEICDEQRKLVQPPSDYRYYTKMCMREATSQALDIASEEALINTQYTDEDGAINGMKIEVNKDSILSIKERVK